MIDDINRKKMQRQKIKRNDQFPSDLILRTVKHLHRNCRRAVQSHSIDNRTASRLAMTRALRCVQELIMFGDTGGDGEAVRRFFEGCTRMENALKYALSEEDIGYIEKEILPQVNLMEESWRRICHNEL